jgi:hypothetical protein
MLMMIIQPSQTLTLANAASYEGGSRYDMGDGVWAMGYGEWGMGHGVWGKEMRKLHNIVAGPTCELPVHYTLRYFNGAVF